MNLSEHHIEDFIRKHKNDFDNDNLNDDHEKKFMNKLYKRFKRIVSIVPYLIRVFIITIIVFVISLWLWNSYIRKDRHDITLKQKIENILTLKK